MAICKGNNPILRGLTITLVIDHLLAGMILQVGVSKNKGIPKSSILIGFSLINRPFWGTTIFWKHPHGWLEKRIRIEDEFPIENGDIPLLC